MVCVIKKSMIIGTMVSISKVKRQVVCNSDYFRAIARSSIIGKILDWIILMRENENLCSTGLQFGCKEEFSTTQCTHVVNETINYYIFNKTNVYILFLDTSREFDRVRYCKLIKFLLKCNLSHRLLRLLAVIYTQQILNVKWKATTGNYFEVSNGVKQGGVLSPTLFAVYVDDLQQKLKKIVVLAVLLVSNVSGLCLMLTV